MPPKYQIVAETLRAQILTGSLAPGDPLPTEHELAETFAVDRNGVIRPALELLRNEGLIVSRRGVGSYVREHRPWIYNPAHMYLTRQPGQPRGTWRSQGARQGRDTVMEIQSVEYVCPPEPAPRLVQDALGGEAWVCRRKRERVDGKPIALYWSWFTVELAENTALVALEPVPQGMLDYMEDTIGVPLIYIDQRLASRPPTPDEAAALELEPGVSIFNVTDVTYGTPPGVSEPVPVHVDVKVIAGNAVEMTYRIPAHAPH